MKVIKTLCITVFFSVLTAIIGYLLAVRNAELSLLYVLLCGLMLSSFQLLTGRSSTKLERYIKVLSPLICMLIIGYMVYVEFNYPMPASLSEKSAVQRAFKYLGELNHQTIRNFLSRFFRIISLKNWITIYTSFTTGIILINTLKNKSYLRELIASDSADEDGSLLRKRMERKSQKFKRRF